MHPHVSVWTPCVSSPFLRMCRGHGDVLVRLPKNGVQNHTVLYQTFSGATKNRATHALPILRHTAMAHSFVFLPNRQTQQGSRRLLPPWTQPLLLLFSSTPRKQATALLLPRSAAPLSPRHRSARAFIFAASWSRASLLGQAALRSRLTSSHCPRLQAGARPSSEASQVLPMDAGQ
jgi:hypothetical protein